MSSPLSGIPARWLWHYHTLQRLRATLSEARREHRVDASAPLERGGTDSIDTADGATELDTLRAEIALEGAELTEIDAALERLRNGTYGICAVTGAPIESARLRAVPWTRFSAAAAAGRGTAGSVPPPP
jgi:RNA polymerase-binding transcription factor DksA